MMCKLKEQMDKGGHYDVELKGWMQKKAIILHIIFPFNFAHHIAAI